MLELNREEVIQTSIADLQRANSFNALFKENNY